MKKFFTLLLFLGISVCGQYPDITVETGSTLKITTNTSVGNLEVKEGATLDISGVTIYIYGNYTNNGTFIGNGSTIAFRGSCAFQVQGSALTFFNLDIDMDPGHVWLYGAATVTNLLNLRNGLIYLYDNDIFLGETPIMNINRASYIVTLGTGKLVRTAWEGLWRAYPVGVLPSGPIEYINLTPVEIQSSTDHNFGVRVVSLYEGPAPINGNHVQSYWEVTPEDPEGVSATLMFYWHEAQEGSFVRSNGVEIGRVFNGGWQPKVATLGERGWFDLYSAYAWFDDFSTFGVGNPGSLPVELTSFNAAIRNGLVDLKWETKTEVNNYGFEVERKSSTADWIKIGFVEGHGSTNSPKYYSYSDKHSGTGKFSYRLKQIDNDGQFEYSPVVEVLVDNLPNGFVLEQNYPNPFNPETSIRFALKEDTKASLKVFNAMGEEVGTLFNGIAEAGRYYDVKFSGNDLSSGFYIYKLVAGEYVSVKKMLLMK